MKELAVPMKKKRRKFDSNFKREAVALWRSSGKLAQEIATQLGIREGQLYEWQKSVMPPRRPGRSASRERSAAQGERSVAPATRHSKKNLGHNLRTPQERCQRIDAMKNERPITTLCEALEVSPSGYYDWRNCQTNPPPRRLEDQRLKEHVLQIHQDSRQTYGAPRVQMHLRSEGRRHGRNRIARLMREQGLCGRQKKRYRVATTDSNHQEPIAPNRLAELPAPKRPDQVWVADITYVSTAQGWVYVAAILDLYSRRIVGWALSQQINTALVMMALNMALLHRQPPKGLIFHSDRAVQYASAEYRQALDNARLVASMSRKANCYDNAAMEAFWNTLKLELIYRCQFEDAAQVRQAIFDYIEVFYNRQRLHSALGYRTPADFECANN